MSTGSKNSLKIHFPPKSSNSYFSQEENQDFYGSLTSKLFLSPFFPPFSSIYALKFLEFPMFYNELLVPPIIPRQNDSKPSGILENHLGRVRTQSSSLELCPTPKYSYLSTYSMKEKERCWRGSLRIPSLGFSRLFFFLWNADFNLVHSECEIPAGRFHGNQPGFPCEDPRADLAPAGISPTLRWRYPGFPLV